jgi:hypothetical protein
MRNMPIKEYRVSALGVRHARLRGTGGALPQADRIADPWGARTPYGPGEEWPPRQDVHLADGVRVEDVERWVPTASLLHSNGDAMDIAVAGGRIVGVRGRVDDRVNRGRLGPKDLYGWQANASPERPARWSATAATCARPTGTPPWSGSCSGPRRSSRSAAPAPSRTTQAASSSSRTTTRW